jgi:hypothetical protein
MSGDVVEPAGHARVDGGERLLAASLRLSIAMMLDRFMAQTPVKRAAVNRVGNDDRRHRNRLRLADLSAELQTTRLVDSQPRIDDSCASHRYQLRPRGRSSRTVWVSDFPRRGAPSVVVGSGEGDVAAAFLVLGQLVCASTDRWAGTA